MSSSFLDVTSDSDLEEAIQDEVFNRRNQRTRKKRQVRNQFVWLWQDYTNQPRIKLKYTYKKARRKH